MSEMELRTTTEWAKECLRSCTLEEFRDWSFSLICKVAEQATNEENIEDLANELREIMRHRIQQWREEGMF